LDSDSISLGVSHSCPNAPLILTRLSLDSSKLSDNPLNGTLFIPRGTRFTKRAYNSKLDK
ncbi:hypothetical protein, partial [Bacillus sp. UNC438CL73TsuS30]|uniref:hypothetical protein n=1 Tax=Bacillus sp. UNC438CL73TsuS30 TaxID=1340434 RepID=UPI003FA45381